MIRIAPVLVALVALLSLSVAGAAEFRNSAGGYMLTYPDDWNVDQEGRERSVTITKPSFYESDGYLWPDSVLIGLTVYPPYDEHIRQGDDDDTILNSLRTRGERRSASSGKPARVIID